MRSHLRTQTGSVTAEFAVVLPTVALVAVTLIGGIVTAAAKVQLAADAGTLARAAARGEDANELASARSLALRLVWQNEFVCAKVSKTLLLPIDAEVCARKGGL